MDNGSQAKDGIRHKLVTGIQTSTLPIYGAAGTVNNSGTWIEASAGYTNSIGSGGGVAFNNSGAVQVQSGNLAVNGGGTSSGSFSVAAGSFLQLIGHTLTSASSVTGAGQVD